MSKTRRVVMRKYIEEALIDGELVHVLECGHAQDGWVDHRDGSVIVERPCVVCEEALPERSLS
jgi:hypothetical protein